MLADKSGENVAPKATSQKIFKWVNIVLAGFLLYCIPGFLSFREVLGAKGYYIFTVQSWWWCLAGFVCYGVSFSGLRSSNTPTFGWCRKGCSISFMISIKAMRGSIG